MNVIIRESKEEDSLSVYNLLRIIADLHKNGRPDMFPDLVSKYTVDEVKERLSKSDNGVFVAEKEGSVVGYVFCDVIREGTVNTLYIDDLCVDPSARKMGIARMLMDKAKEYAKEKNCAYLMLNVWEFNENAVRFYENYGFETRTRHMEIKL
ncbi:MAG: GNAT family N-acetyltransferase [Clostridia bacterium]|nr:GNAT family N-acetyltransferase [Clostridia bacterium]